MMSSTQAVPQRLAAALSPAVGPMTWMQVVSLQPPHKILYTYQMPLQELGRGPRQLRRKYLTDLKDKFRKKKCSCNRSSSSSGF